MRSQTWLLAEDKNGRVTLGPGMRSRGEPNSADLNEMLDWLATSRYQVGDRVVLIEPDGYRVDITRKIERRTR